MFLELIIARQESKEDLKLLVKLAYKFGIKARFLLPNELEDYAFYLAIEEGRSK